MRQRASGGLTVSATEAFVRARTYIPGTYIYTPTYTHLHNTPAYRPSYIRPYTHLPTYLATYLPTYLHPHMPAYLPTHIPTYIPTPSPPPPKSKFLSLSRTWYERRYDPITTGIFTRGSLMKVTSVNIHFHLTKIY